jgi:hypothetical protein
VEELVKVLESTPEYKAKDYGMISLWHGVRHPLVTPERQFGAQELKEANAGTVQISPITSFSDSRDAMVEAALAKASFGGNRSPKPLLAGRYAAEQRWQGHVKADAEQILRVRGGIIDTVRREEGMSVKIDSGLQPKDGYMVARKEYSKIVSAEDFFDATKGKKILGDFLKENRERFQKDQYLGIWWNTKTGKVYLDITDNISDREKAESLGKERNQISIWDVVNKVEIQTGGTGEG